MTSEQRKRALEKMRKANAARVQERKTQIAARTRVQRTEATRSRPLGALEQDKLAREAKTRLRRAAGLSP